VLSGSRTAARSLLTLLLLTVPFMLCTLGLGLLVSTLSRTQQQAMMLTSFVFMLPQVYLSGFIFPIQNMPALFQWITYAVPLRYYVVILAASSSRGRLEVLCRRRRRCSPRRRHPRPRPPPLPPPARLTAPASEVAETALVGARPYTGGSGTSSRRR